MRDLNDGQQPCFTCGLVHESWAPCAYFSPRPGGEFITDMSQPYVKIGRCYYNEAAIRQMHADGELSDAEFQLCMEDLAWQIGG